MIDRRGQLRREPGVRRTSIVVLLLVAAQLLSGGCSRAYYRRQADIEADKLVREKANHPQWPLEQFNVYVDPRSRMFDPFNPDGPPMPPDDPASHKLMHKVDGKKGYPGWHRNGDVPFVDNPAWIDYLPIDEKGILRLTSVNAPEIALLHSRTYQSEVEQVYLSALDVSFERFRFSSQFFAGYQTVYTADGKDRAGGGGQSKSTLVASTFSKGQDAAAWTMQRSFTTGADLVVGFANSLVWQFSGPDDYQGNTLIDFTLVQPLLRNAGRDRIMERLTLAERTLLANVRAMERFRGQFYVDIMTGRNAGQGPNRRGGVLGGSGFEGFSGLGASGFGAVATTNQINQSGTPATGAGATQAGGYIGLLQQQQQIRNQQDNINRLRANLYRLEVGLQEMLTTIPVDQEQIPRQRLQVAQAKQALFVAEGRLINAQNQFQALLDNYKVQLGLPPEICVRVEDPLIDRFNLLDDQIKPRQDKIEEVIQSVGQTNDQLLLLAKEQKDPNINVIIRSLEWSNELKNALTRLEKELQPIKSIASEINQVNLKRAEEDLQRLTEALPRRRQNLLRLKQKYQEQESQPCPLMPLPQIDAIVFDTKRLENLEVTLNRELDRLRESFGEFASRLKQLDDGIHDIQANGGRLEPRALFDAVRDRAVLGSQDLLTDLRIDLLALELLQVQARTEALELVDVELPACEAMKIASVYRQDVMNARAALVDSWRLIEFNADNLESSLDLFFSGDVGNTTSNPFHLKSSTGRLRVGAQFDAPITRLSERNTYRQSLIEYQQARRSYYQFEDQVSQGLRATLRTLEANQFNFELQRYAVLIAAQQIDLNEDIRILREALRQPSGATAARDSVSALSDLLNAQNDFLSVWVNYEVLRRYLDLDLGTMQLDQNFQWIDPGPIGPDHAKVVDALLGKCEPIPDDPIRASEIEVLENVVPSEATKMPSREILPHSKALLPNQSPQSSQSPEPGLPSRPALPVQPNDTKLRPVPSVPAPMPPKPSDEFEDAPPKYPTLPFIPSLQTPDRSDGQRSSPIRPRAAMLHQPVSHSGKRLLADTVPESIEMKNDDQTPRGPALVLPDSNLRVRKLQPVRVQSIAPFSEPTTGKRFGDAPR